MKRCIEPDRVFETLDDHDACRALEEHLSTCAACRKLVSRYRAMRDAARASMEPDEPNWETIDRSVEGAIRDLTTRPTRSAGWAPAALSAAAAVLIALALFRAAGVEEQGAEVRFEAPHPLKAQVVALTPPPLLKTVLDETLDLREGSEEPGPVRDGESWITGDSGAVLLAIGETARLWARDATSFAVPSTQVEAYTVDLKHGKLFLEVPTGALERDIMVMSAGEIFAIFEGAAEFYRTADGISVEVSSGEVISFGDGGPRPLLPGYRYTRSATGEDVTGSDWVQIARMDTPSSADLETEMSETTERPVISRGTLPLSVVREAMERSKPRITKCYEASLKRYPSLRNEVSIRARIGVSSKGTVSKVRINGVSDWPVLKGCLEGVLTDMSFPQPDGGPLELIFPLRLSPLR